MYCTNCSRKKVLKGKKITYKYDESGLENVTLDGVVEYRCPDCGEVYHNFGDIDQLHNLITNMLLTKKELLTAKEVRFLRTYVGYSSAYFSKVLGYEPETLSRIENDKKPVTKTFDKHVREAIFNKAPDRYYDLHDAILFKPTIIKDRIEIVTKKNKWVAKFDVSPLIMGTV